MISNPALETKPDAPPKKLLLTVCRGRRCGEASGLKTVERAIQKYGVKFVKAADRRYAATFKTHVAASLAIALYQGKCMNPESSLRLQSLSLEKFPSS